ncbi:MULTISPECIES: glucose-6-phosphate dehydrogenase [Rhodobacterales]|jgi:glucose-6-phosphate 1-dehydrogenase|uniref:glucose-6-phosphate dehydrogenase n=1 Tax=Rhodobacterales TaxID=204455 RepID=UPI00237F51D5|nr:glucose-6-phosphate dehydrogenase [Phaeobacter gallaeciensis]MDE4139348.1 glucose-6-phosphate dehydrogenase [Phaeobacter gallaeciensis]MDE4147594.1 glucose-6-phosphate dehydrogenase [Phaeobacter gallaeciensis]MDE4151813.1 glucose-6-phosphate dehydrogenase [Phaeobacter gallaeciensis]MDE4227403.1 glucose-6-phosphate dehydrogenase [Phaeobacter gallaeciensis]MDE4256277.1 glucose-6-phosphate dehydrogenase [Phaeobacter gallaeciensis]
MAPRVIPVDPFDLVIFGGTGDLAQRKILPALYRRFCGGHFPEEVRIIGAARADIRTEDYRQMVAEGIKATLNEHGPGAAGIPEFLRRVTYVSLDAREDRGWEPLAAQLAEVEPRPIRVFYFSVGPGLFGPLAERLHRHGLSDEDSRIVVEKPFGHDLQSAKALNATLAAHFTENQIYRIDHYLGKETVQNLMAIRFGNMLFEPLWNSQYVDHIQITVAETVGVAGREEYYDRAGAMRDMMQNHLMQLLCLIAMEPPAKFDPDAVRDEKVKVIRALDPVEPYHIVRGQYNAAAGGEGPDLTYRETVGNPRSSTESYIALKTHISNWRWAGTPFYLRTGKRLVARSSVINVLFKDAPHSIFGEEAGRHANHLKIRLQPNEGITLSVTIKEPGPGGMRLVDVPLDMSFATALGADGKNPPDAYERLITDMIRGNQTLFMRGDEVTAAWAWTDPIIAGWQARGDVPKPYDMGSTGPGDADLLMRRDGREWRGINP